MTPRDQRDDEFDAFDDVDAAGYGPWDGEPGGWSGEVYDESYPDALPDAYNYADDNSAPSVAVRPTGWLDRLRRHGQRLINTIAFGIPLALLAVLLGVGAILNRDSGETSSAGSQVAAGTPVFAESGAWPPGVVFARTTLPAMIKDVISTPGAQRGYQFNGTVGQVWTLTAEPLYGSALNPALSLYAPSGVLLLQNDDRAVGDVTAAIVVQLDEDGPYRVVVEATGGASTGDYLFSLFAQ